MQAAEPSLFYTLFFLPDETNDQEVPAEIDDKFNLIDEYSNCQEKLHEQEKKITSIWEYCDLIWDIIEDEKQRIDRFEKLKVRMEDTQHRPTLKTIIHRPQILPQTMEIIMS